MPNIKYKPFALSQASCYQCGKEISQGDLNWSYNTRKAGMFRHAVCSLSESQFQEQIEKPESQIPPQTPIQATPTVLEKPTAILGDITDRIITKGRHKQTDFIKRLLKIRKYPFLWGAPGAGKSHLVLQIAEDMGLEFVMVSLTNDMFKSELLGSVSPISGNYHATAFFKAFKSGGVVLLDECGFSNGPFLSVLNGMMAQKEMRFPNGERVKMHENFFLVLADNSALHGDDPNFPERQDAGMAFRNRIKYIKFEYDTTLELQVITARFNGDLGRARTWHLAVLNMRNDLAKANSGGKWPIASPRFAYESADMFTVGFNFDECVECNLMEGMNGDIHKLAMPIINKYRGSY